jgi:hypothetical protein
VVYLVMCWDMDPDSERNFVGFTDDEQKANRMLAKNDTADHCRMFKLAWLHDDWDAVLDWLIEEGMPQREGMDFIREIEQRMGQELRKMVDESIKPKV